MNFDYVSDLHIDYWVKVNSNQNKASESLAEYIIWLLPEKPNNTLVIVGDLGHYNNQIKDLLLKLKKIYKNIIITFGNHDLYLVSKKQSKIFKYNSILRIEDLKKISKELGVHFLDGTTVTIDGVKFGGLCSWYKLQEDDIRIWKTDMNDYNFISKTSYKPLYTYYIANNRVPIDPIEFYENEMSKLNNIIKEGCDVLISHIPLLKPMYSTEDLEFIDDKYSKYYYTDNFLNIKASQCRVYIHGHTHNTIVDRRDEIDILCNPLGHPEDATHCRIKEYNFEK